ncbi:hypothetical protein BDZ94DRAFT_1186690 [Collybia nuda]|uniref:Mitochondrial import inner membrane translocase subunit TIM50 n=1 Tax=Collybia nuda TaxID=64659 RepID=A0A9P5YDH6_9AGAR|nr:hypothetical protein BDZ94DRAFT_1186690 [Collybia nuda]
MPMSTPTPTISDDYIRESEKPSAFIEDPSSSRKLLILDLNGTLVFRSPHYPREYKPRHRRNNYSQNPQDRTSSPPHNPDPYADPTALRPLRTVYPRPYLTPFREYLFHPSTREWLDTMVWSSAQPHSVADMVEKCFGEKKDDLVAVWARDTLGLAAKDYNRKTQTTKDLAKPWAALPLPSSDPRTWPMSTSADRFYSARTTILLDDSPLKAHLQPYNHLCIREYVAELRNADLAFRSSEEALLRRNAEGLEEQEFALTGSEVQSSASESPVTERFNQNDADKTSERHQGFDRGKLGSEDVNTGKRKRRRRPKHKKHAVGQRGTATDDQMTSPISYASASTYDQTLLAVIGILHNIKRESNIAGWMRSGGPLNCQTQGKREADHEGEGSLHIFQGEGRKIKRRRTSQELHSADVAAVATSLLNTPVIKSYPSNADGAITTQNNTGLWYEDSLSMAYWVRRGVEALEELTIEIAPGVEA